MEIVLKGLQREVCLIYRDDIIVVGKKFNEMMNNLGKVFERLKKANLKIKATNCCLCAKEVLFLGHLISETGIATYPSKKEVIKKWPVPANVTKVRSFLGFVGYYRRYIRISVPRQNICIG